MFLKQCSPKIPPRANCRPLMLLQWCGHTEGTCLRMPRSRREDVPTCHIAIQLLWCRLLRSSWGSSLLTVPESPGNLSSGDEPEELRAQFSKCTSSCNECGCVEACRRLHAVGGSAEATNQSNSRTREGRLPRGQRLPHACSVPQAKIAVFGTAKPLLSPTPQGRKAAGRAQGPVRPWT